MTSGRLVFLLVACALLAGISSAQAQDACKDKFKRDVADCANAAGSDPARDPADYSFWDKCTAKFKPELDKCRAGGAASNAGASMATPPGCEEAKIGIDWILVKDAGARQSYERAIGNNKSTLEALLYAQRHNPKAQAAIRKCGAWAVAYAGGTSSTTGSSNQPKNSSPQSADLGCVALGPVTNNYESKRSQSVDGSVPLWSWTIPIGDNCSEPVRVRFCLHEPNDFIQSADHTYGRGHTNMSAVLFNIISGDPPGAPPIWLKCRLNEPCQFGC